MSSTGSAFLDAVLNGRVNTPEEWAEYTAAFHRDHPEANELFTLLLTPSRFTSYEMLAAAIARHPCESILDLGCGDGNLVDPLREACGSEASILGIDSCDREIELARARYSDDKNVRFECGDAYALECPSESFDVVVSHQCLNFALSPEKLLAEAARVLKPGGWILTAINRGWRHDRENTWVYLDQAAQAALRSMYPNFVWPRMGDKRMYEVETIREIFAASDALDDSSLTIEEYRTGAFMTPQHIAAVYNRLYLYGSIPQRTPIHEAVIARARELADPRNLVEVDLPFRLISVRKRA